MIDFASRIRLMRDLLGWRQFRLATEINVHPNTVSKWEMGIQKPHKKYERQLVILAERNNIVFDGEGYPRYAKREGFKLASKRG